MDLPSDFVTTLTILSDSTDSSDIESKDDTISHSCEESTNTCSICRWQFYINNELKRCYMCNQLFCKNCRPSDYPYDRLRPCCKKCYPLIKSSVECNILTKEIIEEGDPVEMDKDHCFKCCIEFKDENDYIECGPCHYRYCRYCWKLFSVHCNKCNHTVCENCIGKCCHYQSEHCKTCKAAGEEYWKFKKCKFCKHLYHPNCEGENKCSHCSKKFCKECWNKISVQCDKCKKSHCRMCQYYTFMRCTKCEELYCEKCWDGTFRYCDECHKDYCEKCWNEIYLGEERPERRKWCTKCRNKQKSYTCLICNKQSYEDYWIDNSMHCPECNKMTCCKCLKVIHTQGDKNIDKFMRCESRRCFNIYCKECWDKTDPFCDGCNKKHECCDECREERSRICCHCSKQFYDRCDIYHRERCDICHKYMCEDCYQKISTGRIKVCNDCWKNKFNNKKICGFINNNTVELDDGSTVELDDE